MGIYPPPPWTSFPPDKILKFPIYGISSPHPKKVAHAVPILHMKFVFEEICHRGGRFAIWYYPPPPWEISAMGFLPGWGGGGSVCVSVCPANSLVFYISAIRRDIDLKFIQDTYMVVLDSLNKIHRAMVKVTGTVHCFLKVQSYHKNWAIEKIIIVFIDTLFDETIGYSIRRNNKNWSEQRNDVTKYTPIFDFNMNY